MQYIVSSKRIPQTTAHVRITRQSWQNGLLEGEVKAGELEWQIYPGKHGFSEEMRKRAYQFLDRHLFTNYKTPGINDL